MISALQRAHGPIALLVTDPFEMILFENVAYLVDDPRRIETFRSLRDQIGLTPAAILERTADEIAEVIGKGGMQPLMRAGKVIDCAKLAEKQGLEQLRKAVIADPAGAKKMLRQYPGVGEPYADKILLFAGSQLGLAPDSNALRTLLRLGFGAEQKGYTASYRSVTAATSGAFAKPADAQQAHLLLRRHGQEICKRAAPRCELCPLRASCAWYARHSSA